MVNCFALWPLLWLAVGEASLRLAAPAPITPARVSSDEYCRLFSMLSDGGDVSSLLTAEGLRLHDQHRCHERSLNEGFSAHPRFKVHHSPDLHGHKGHSIFWATQELNQEFM